MSTKRTRKQPLGTDLEVRNAAPGKHPITNAPGLFVNVKQTGRRSWVLRITHPDGKQRDHGLGTYPEVGLAAARRAAAERTLAIQSGTGTECGKPAPAPKAPVTFRETAKAVHAQLKPTWRNKANKQSDDWWARLENHAAPLLPMPVAEIDRADVLGCLLPIWTTKPSTARRLRQDIRKVLGYAMALDDGIASNAAGESIDGALLVQPKAVAHRRAIPFEEVPKAYEMIGACDMVAAVLTLRFQVLTGVRPVEAREARWSEIDADAAVWTIPAERMKAGTPHRVPLSRQAIYVLIEAKKLGGTELVFPSLYNGGTKPVADKTVRLLLERNMIDASPHGFRTSLRQWMLNQPEVSYAIGETVLAHSLGSQVAQAYIRDADLLEQRRPIMQAWADFVAPNG